VGSGDATASSHVEQDSGERAKRAEYIALCKKGVFKYLRIERPIENIQVYGTTVIVTGHAKMDVCQLSPAEHQKQDREKKPRHKDNFIAEAIYHNATLAALDRS
jgi:hypothetical protein